MYRSMEERLVYKSCTQRTLIQKHQGGSPMEPMYYIGLDVHKRKISYCVKDSGGKVYSEGSLSATRLDENAAPSVERGDGSDHVYGVDLRLPQATCSRPEGGTPADAAGHCSGEKEERPHRRQQDLRLSALRFSAGVLYGSD